MSFIAERILAVEKATDRNYFEAPQATFNVDARSRVQSAFAALPDVRATIDGWLAEYHANGALIPGLRSFVRYQSTRDALAAAGFPLSDAEGFPFEDSTSSESAKAAVEQRLRNAMRATLEAKIKPLADRAVQTAIDEISADLETLAAGEPVTRKYKAPPSPLADGLRNALDRLRADLNKPVDLAWHYDPRMAISQAFFPDDAPLAVEQLKDGAIVGPGDALKTAADIAASRAV